MHGAVPFSPTSNNLRFSDRAASTATPRGEITNRRFFSRMQTGGAGAAQRPVCAAAGGGAIRLRRAGLPRKHSAAIVARQRRRNRESGSVSEDPRRLQSRPRRNVRRLMEGGIGLAAHSPLPKDRRHRIREARRLTKELRPPIREGRPMVAVVDPGRRRPVITVPLPPVAIAVAEEAAGTPATITADAVSLATPAIE